MTCLSSNKNNRPKKSKNDLFILSLKGIKLKNGKLSPISNDIMKYLDCTCLTMNELMDKLYENVEMNDVICENCSKINGKSSKAKF